VYLDNMACVLADDRATMEGKALATATTLGIVQGTPGFF
jgi:hypothetical protein